MIELPDDLGASNHAACGTAARGVTGLAGTIAIRVTKLVSSRRLPGNGYRMSVRIAAASSVSAGLRVRRAWRTSIGRSPGRSRNGAIERVASKRR